MSRQILTDKTATISELQADPMQVLANGNRMPVAILDGDEPAFYCVPAEAYEAMMELLDDIELMKLVKERADEPAVKLALDDL